MPARFALGYSNPTPITTWTVTEATKIWNVGLCHSVQGTAEQIAGYLGAPMGEVTYWAAGINHQSWFLRYEWNKQDAYPLLFEKMNDPEIYRNDMVRFELMKRNCSDLGVFLSSMPVNWTGGVAVRDLSRP